MLKVCSPTASEAFWGIQFVSAPGFKPSGLLYNLFMAQWNWNVWCIHISNSNQAGVVSTPPAFYLFIYLGSERGCAYKLHAILKFYFRSNRGCAYTLYVCAFGINAWTTSKKSHLTFWLIHVLYPISTRSHFTFPNCISLIECNP